MKNSENSITERFNELVENEEYIAAENLLNETLKDDSENVEVLLARAKLYRQLQKFPDAFNDLQYVLKLAPEHTEAKNLLHLTQDILRYQKLDIYSSTNLNYDPWLE